MPGPPPHYLGHADQLVGLRIGDHTFPKKATGGVFREDVTFENLKDCIIEGATFVRPVTVVGVSTLNCTVRNCRFNGGLKLKAGTSWRVEDCYFNSNPFPGHIGLDARGHDGLIAHGNIFDLVDVAYFVDSEATIGPDWIDVHSVKYHWHQATNNHLTVIRGRGFSTASNYTGVSTPSNCHTIGW